MRREDIEKLAEVAAQAAITAFSDELEKVARATQRVTALRKAVAAERADLEATRAAVDAVLTRLAKVERSFAKSRQSSGQEVEIRERPKGAFDFSLI